MSMRDVLRKQQLFKELSNEAFSILEKGAKLVGFEPGEVIITIGQMGKYFGIVIKGQLEALNMAGTRLGVIDEGEYVGEMSLLTGDPSIADVQSVTPSRVLLIPHIVMSRILPESSFLLKQLSSTMRARLLQRESSLEEQEALHKVRASLPGPASLLTTPSAPAMKLLIVNCLPTSLRWNFFDLHAPDLVFRGRVARIGLTSTIHIMETGPRGTVKLEQALADTDHGGALEEVLNFLTGPKGPLNSKREIDALGHRVIHGGERYSSPVVIDDEVVVEIKKLAALAPVHNPAGLAGIEAAMKLMPDTPQVAVFDTAFHRTIPTYAFMYGLPGDYYKERGVRRFGFHGTTHHYVALEAAAFVKRPLDELKIISCRLGKDASICAVDHGRSIDSSMGMTPLEGLVMGTRCGDLDPGVILHLAQEGGLKIEEIQTLLNSESGLLGLSGISEDFREIIDAAGRGDQDALTAIQVFCYRVKKYIGAYTAALGGLDVLVFTGGIGMGSAGVRARVCQGLSYLGVILDEIKNRSLGIPETIQDISDSTARCRVLVIPTQDEKMIARETLRALKQKEALDIIGAPTNKQKEIPILVSLRHVHLNEEAKNLLFGPDYALTPDERLSQTGQLVFKERVTLVGPRGHVENVRIQGPLKIESQVEIGRSEEFLLGIDAPVRESGNLSGTPGITIEGPKGKAVLQRGVINAQRHIQMDPEDALAFGIRDGDRVMVTVGGERALIFPDVLIRVSPYHRLEMHIDADDANAAGIEMGMTGKITGMVGRRSE